MRGTTTSVQTLIESGHLLTRRFLFNSELSLGSSGTGNLEQPQHNDVDVGSCGGARNSQLHILNAVKLSLMLTRAFGRCYNIRKNASFVLDDFVVKLELLLNACEDHGEASNPGDEQLPRTSTVDEFNAITSDDCDEWVLLDIEVKYLDSRFPSEHASTAAVMQSVGKLLFAIFSQNNDAFETEALYSKGEIERRTETLHHSSKTRRSASKSLFQQYIELGFPISVCRFLSDLIDSDMTHHSIISFDEIIHDLEQMISHPQVFLFNPANDFYTSTLNFGQRYYGRSKELAKLFEITTIPNESRVDLEAIFVSGMAGSGKSHLVSAVGSFISSFEFMVLRAKFKRGMEYESRDVVSNLMHDMVSNIVQMKESDNDSDVDYSRRASQAISTAFDADSLSALADFIPSIQSLVPDAVKKENVGCSNWQLVLLLSKLLCSVLGQERKIFIALDDLQWADPTTLELVKEVLISICQCPEERQRLVFVGMYRDNEVSSHLTSFTKSFGVAGGVVADVTHVKLSTLSLDDVIEMIMTEMRLPRRLVSELADVVHKRTHGHALFVVQLLNSLVSDLTISYSPLLHRFYWDQDNICILNTADNVASLIVSNLTSLPIGELQCLRIISCFGMQVHIDLLELLEVFKMAPQGGFGLYLRNLCDQGIIEVISTLVVFTHDLIQEQVYKIIPLKERQQLHCEIGIFLGSKTSLGASSEHKPIDAAMDQLYLSDVSDNEETYIDASSLVAIATSQINHAGPEFFSDRAQHIRFANWNFCAGTYAADHSSFRAALHYYKNGIAFLSHDLWLEDTYELCLKLYEGAAFSSSALGENSQIVMYANGIINNVNLEDSLVAQSLLIGSLSVLGKYTESVARGITVLRQLKFDIPATQTPVVVMQTIERTEREASMYNFSQIANNQKRGDTKTRKILKLVESIAAACYQIASPWLPLVACETVRYSLQHGIHAESASSFGIVAFFQVFIKQSFESGRQWGTFATNILESVEGPTPATIRPRFFLCLYVNFWYVSLQTSINHMREIEEMSLKFGDTSLAYMTKSMRFKFQFFRGERLSTLSQTFDMNLQTMARFTGGSLKYSVLDREMIDSLTGDISSTPYAVFNGKIRNKQFLLADAQSKMHLQIAEAVHLKDFNASFWMGDYIEAAKSSDIALSFPSAKMPKVQLIYHMFYRGIVMFHLYREGKGETCLEEGNKMQDQVQIWVKNSKPIFENKLVLLEAEHYASMGNVVAAKESYELSVELARDNGYVHEQGLAYECMGKYLMSIVEIRESARCFLHAHKCYTQWGALAKASKLWKDWNLGSSTESIEPSTIKHQRDEYK